MVLIFTVYGRQKSSIRIHSKGFDSLVKDMVRVIEIL